MLRSLQQRDARIKFLLWAIVISVGGAMVITLAPGPVGSMDERGDVVATVAGANITMLDVQNQLARFERRQPIPQALRPFYAQQVIDALMFERMLDAEARRLGIRVTDEEVAERLKLLVPGAFDGGQFAGRERYALAVETQFGMGVAEFEQLVRKAMLEEKFRRLVTDGLTVSYEDVEREYRRRNEKVKFDYAVVDPAEMESRVRASAEELKAYYDANTARYMVPERRIVRYIHLDIEQVRSRVTPSEDDLRAYYNANIEQYRQQNRARVSHILLKTTGLTDSEIAETQKKAEDLLQRIRRGAKFEDMAKQHSQDDANKDKGGDLGWIVPGQTVPEFEQAAFSLPIGQVSDLVKTSYGFHIIRVAERQPARTQPFEEVRGSILPIVQQERAEAEVNAVGDRLAAATRGATRRSLDEIARDFNLTVRESGPVAAGDPIGDVGNPAGLSGEVFSLAVGEMTGVVRTDRGYAVAAVKEIQPAHQGTFEEVRARVESDYRREKGQELARTRSQELVERAKTEPLPAVARSLGLEVKSSEPLARTGTVPGLGSARQLSAAFTLPVNGTSEAINLGGRWVVLRVTAREEANMAGLAAQRRELEAQILSSKQSLAYESFRESLEARLRAEGKLRVNPELMKRLTATS